GHLRAGHQGAARDQGSVDLLARLRSLSVDQGGVGFHRRLDRRRDYPGVRRLVQLSRIAISRSAARVRGVPRPSERRLGVQRVSARSEHARRVLLQSHSGLNERRRQTPRPIDQIWCPLCADEGGRSALRDLPDLWGALPFLPDFAALRSCWPLLVLTEPVTSE